MIRLGVDFGESCTVIMRYDTVTGAADGEPLYSPNIVHLNADGSRINGSEVIARGLLYSEATARHLRHYILRLSPRRIANGPHTVTCDEAARDHLVSLIKEAGRRGNGIADELVFSLPADAPQSYSGWLASVSEEAGFHTYSVTDEILAAALGYGVSVRAGYPVVLIDFGTDSFAVSVGNPVQGAGDSPPSFRLVGRAVADIGGGTLDRWLMEDYLKVRGTGLFHGNPGRDTGWKIDLFRNAKEALSFVTETTIPLPGKDGGEGPGHEIAITRSELEPVLEKRSFFSQVTATIEKALVMAKSRGYDEDRISSVLMTGGGCLIPSLREVVRRRFGRVSVMCSQPREATAYGAARYSHRGNTRNRIARDYALRYWDAENGEHQYRYIVRRGTGYPSRGEVSRLQITASYDGQTHLGLALYALGSEEKPENPGEIELVSDPGGSFRRIDQAGHTPAIQADWVNENAPTLLVATPPAAKGVVRFELAFRIDQTGRLLVRARDVQSGLYVLENHCMARLA